jgi:hypothetical protein
VLRQVSIPFQTLDIDLHPFGAYIPFGHVRLEEVDRRIQIDALARHLSTRQRLGFCKVECQAQEEAAIVLLGTALVRDTIGIRNSVLDVVCVFELGNQHSQA